MDDFSMWGTPSKRKGKKEKNIFASEIDLGFGSKKGRPKKQPTLGFNLGIPTKKEPKRDLRRAFTRTQQTEILYQQDSKCARCHTTLDPRAIEFDHKKPWAAGGRTIKENGRALCANCHKIVTHETTLKGIEKIKKPKSEFIPWRDL